MELSLVQIRIYDDTFGGGDYDMDMEENLGLRAPFVETDHAPGQPPAGPFYKTDRQKALYQEFQKRKRRVRP